MGDEPAGTGVVDTPDLTVDREQATIGTFGFDGEVSTTVEGERGALSAPLSYFGNEAVPMSRSASRTAQRHRSSPGASIQL
jgi:hypothetical protein